MKYLIESLEPILAMLKGWPEDAEEYHEEEWEEHTDTIGMYIAGSIGIIGIVGILLFGILAA